MKTLKFILLGLFVFPVAIIAQNQMKSCCAPNISTQNAILASNNEFAKTHAEPLPYHLENQEGNMISIKCKDNKSANAYLIRSTTKSDKYLIVIHEWWGLNDYIKKESEHLFNDLSHLNVNVIAIDLYDGESASTREAAQKLMVKMNQARNENIINGVLDYVGKDAQVATIGWCMGGSWSLQTAILGGDKIKGCVMYYGFPEQNMGRLEKIKSPVLGLFASKDKWITGEVVSQFEKNMNIAGKKVEIHQFDADHAFANPSNPVFDEKASKEAYTLAIGFLREKLK